MAGRTIGRRWLSLALLVLGILHPVWAQPEQPTDTDDLSPHSDAELVSEAAWIQPGEPFVVALRLQMDAGWHSYWQNPGDSGEPTAITWDLPEGVSSGAIQWPYPHRIDSGPLTSYGYSDEVFLLTEITPPASLQPGTSVTLDGHATWLICAEICLPAESELRLTLPVRSEAPAPSDWHDAIAAARAKLPADLPSWNVRAARSGDTYALQITPPNGRSLPMEGATFFPAEKATLEHAAPQPVTHEGAAYLMALQQSEYAQKPADRLRGVLVAPDGAAWDAENQVHAVAIDVPVEDARLAGLSADSQDASMTLLWALLFAFVGGMILNLMPCVFPILSIKILGVAQQTDEADTTIRKHGLVFGAGVLVSFWILAGLLLGLRAGGSEIGWGFQLQSPLFVAFMAMLFFGIGLSLLGVVEVGAGLMRWGGRLERTASSTSFGGSFLSGVLATVVATPCTAPLMGAALGVALTLSATDALFIFTALGLGMALPYVALSMAPRLLKRLPKPGAWMNTLKQVLAFPMFATTVWLAWVFGQQVGINGVALLLCGLLLLGGSAWILGHWTAAQISAKVRLLTRSLATLGLIGALAASLIGTQYQPATGGTAGSTAEAAWQPFSADRVEQLRAAGQPVFVDFTAAWCLTCQVNKRTTLQAAAVRQAFEEKQVALLRADWTNQDPEITRALEAHGRSGVPLYVLYKGDGSKPVLLPEILTEALVLDALNDLPSRTTVASTEASATNPS